METISWLYKVKAEGSARRTQTIKDRQQVHKWFNVLGDCSLAQVEANEQHVLQHKHLAIKYRRIADLKQKALESASCFISDRTWHTRTFWYGSRTQHNPS